MKKIRIATLSVVATVVLAWAVPAMAAHSRTAGTTVTVVGTEFHFALSKTSVPHGAVTFKFTNKGALPHDFSINGKKTPVINPKASATLTVTFAKAGSYPYLCTVPGHAAGGMKGTLKVT
ncbi:MAG TPA: cupredoxin domain-containing protein [Gaiellaceae bacterium]|nr:cupredoxin domain-containing protein [Gaiellaceae bacterium]